MKWLRDQFRRSTQVRSHARSFARQCTLVLASLVLMIPATLTVAANSPAAAREKTTQGPSRVYINAKAAVVMDAQTHELIYSKQAEQAYFPASTTKLMTAILLVTYLQPDDPVYISPGAAHQSRVRLGLKAGTTITADQALHGILMKSANDIAYAVAETIGGSEAGFSRMMNVKARLLGCKNTNFVTPNGLHDDEHQSSAHDLALILSEAIKHEQIVRTMQTKDYAIAGHTIRNGNRMMYLGHTAMGDVIGGKTGYTSKAMYCLAFAVRQGDKVRISVVLGAPRKSAMYRETRRLLEMAGHGQAVRIV